MQFSKIPNYFSYIPTQNKTHISIAYWSAFAERKAELILKSFHPCFIVLKSYQPLNIHLYKKLVKFLVNSWLGKLVGNGIQWIKMFSFYITKKHEIFYIIKKYEKIFVFPQYVWSKQSFEMKKTLSSPVIVSKAHIFHLEPFLEGTIIYRICVCAVLPAVIFHFHFSFEGRVDDWMGLIFTNCTLLS